MLMFEHFRLLVGVASVVLLLVALITLGAIALIFPAQVGMTEFLIVGELTVFEVGKEPALTFAILLSLACLLPLGLGYASLLRAGLKLSDVGTIQRKSLAQEQV